MPNQPLPFYGVRVRTTHENKNDAHIENIARNGFSIVPSNLSEDELKAIEVAFEAAHKKQNDTHGLDYLTSIDEHNTIRCLIQHDELFFKICNHPDILDICHSMIGPYVILNQQNGIINPGNSQRYNQGYYHRDLPYQHFTSSRPIAMNALFCLDDFTPENGATWALPGSHKHEAFPSESYVENNQIQATAKRGDFVIMDCMLYHSGGVNTTNKTRRAINNVYTIPMMRQQIEMHSLPNLKDLKDPELRKLLGFDFPAIQSEADYYKSREKK